MTKRKKLVIFLICIFVVALIGIGVYWGVNVYKDSQIQFTVNDTLPDGQGKKATVILLGGQSNASGCSIDEYLKKNVSPEKYAEYDAGLHIQGCDNSHNLISIEGVPVYNASHLLGFFSTFNPSHFSRMSITKSNLFFIFKPRI